MKWREVSTFKILVVFSILLFCAKPATAGVPVLEYFSAYKDALQAIIGPIATQAAQNGWDRVNQNMATDKGETIESIGQRLDLSDSNTDPNILINTIDKDFLIAIVAGYENIGLAIGLNAIASVINMADNVLALAQIPSEISVAWGRMDYTVSTIEDIALKRRVNFWQLAQAVSYNISFDKKAFLTAFPLCQYE